MNTANLSCLVGLISWIKRQQQQRATAINVNCIPTDFMGLMDIGDIVDIVVVVFFFFLTCAPGS